jgi:hypothetical protein
MQRWLLENGRLNEGTARPEMRRPILRWLALAGIAILMLVLALIASQGGGPTAGDATVEPTVTMVANP